MTTAPGRLLFPTDRGTLEEVPVSGRVTFSNAAVRGTVDTMNPQAGIMFYLLQMDVLRPMEFTASDRAEAGTLTSTSIISGQADLRPAGAAAPAPLERGRVAVLNPRERAMDFTMDTGPKRWLAITITPEALVDFRLSTPPDVVRGLLEQGAAPMRTDLRLDDRMRRVQRDLIDHPFEGHLREMYLQAKALEFVTLQLAALDALDPRDGGRPRHARARARDARHILLSQAEQPPDLETLAQAVGVTPRELTRLFREEFGATPFAYLRDHRLDQARLMLEAGDEVPLKQIAWQAGYRHPSNFTLAFKRRFGVAPGEYRRARAVAGFRPPGPAVPPTTDPG